MKTKLCAMLSNFQPEPDLTTHLVDLPPSPQIKSLGETAFTELTGNLKDQKQSGFFHWISSLSTGIFVGNKVAYYYQVNIMLSWMNKPPPPPRPVTITFQQEWRTVNWSEAEKQRMLEGLKKFQLRTSKVSHLRILLHGSVGSGKSSFINSVNTVLQGHNTSDALANATSSTSFTLEYKTYKLKKEYKEEEGKSAVSYYPFVFNDMRGLEQGSTSGVQSDDMISIINGHVKNGYTFNPVKELTKDNSYYNKSPTPDDKVHCLVSVLPGDVISIGSQDVINQMKRVREKVRDLSIPQVIIMTMVDKICPLVSNDLKMIYRSKKIKDKMQECSNLLGVPMNCIFPVKNYSEEITNNTNVDLLILMAMTNIVNFAHDYVERQ